MATARTIFTAGFLTESTDFSPIATREEHWRIEEAGESDGPASRYKRALGIFFEMAVGRGWEVAESICATCYPPGGRTVRSVYENIRRRILDDLRGAMPVDGVLLQLHGGALAYGYDDCEGDLLKAIRSIVGPAVPIGVELDPHCHMTEQMLRNSTVMVLYKTSAHTDIEERAREVFELTADAIVGKTKPTQAVAASNMIDLFDDSLDPVKAFLETVVEEEKKAGVLSVSPVHGFPYADVKDLGSKVLVVTDGDPALAQETADRLARELFSLRGQLDKQPDISMALDEAHTRARNGRKGIQIVDWSDLAGCGFPTDGTELLSAMLRRGMTDVVAGCIWDPLAVSICHDAGEGVELELRFGGKSSSMSGPPIDLDVVIERVYKHTVIRNWDGSNSPCDAVVVRSGNTEVLLTSERILGTGFQPFEDLGVVPGDKTYVLTKFLFGDESTRPSNERAILAFGRRTDLRSLNLRNIDDNLWPWNDQPGNAEGCRS